MSENEIIQELYKKFTFAPVLRNTHGRMTITQWYTDNKLTYYKSVGMLGHGALDMRAKIGTPTYAPFDGVVESVYSNTSVDEKRGEYVRLISKEVTIEDVIYRLRSNQYHLHQANVTMGEAVKKGQQVGETGNTGKITTGPHLHFAVKLYKKVEGYWTQAFPSNGYFGAIDPYPFFWRADLTGIPTVTERIYPGTLVKSLQSSKVYFVNKTGGLIWVEDEYTFYFGKSHGWWKGFSHVNEIQGKLKEDYRLKLTKV